jgi:hypothetical protein
MEKLATGTKRVSILVAVIAKESGTTIQGVYKALRALKLSGAVTVHNKDASLSLIWLNKEKQRLGRIEQVYFEEQHLIDFIEKEKHRAKFIFHRLRDLDHFWVQAFTVLTDQLDRGEYSYSIQPHDWYYYSDLDSDAFWIGRHTDFGRISRIVLTHAAGLDYVVVRKRKLELDHLFEYTLGENPLKQKSHEYYNVIGPYIFKAVFDEEKTKALDTFIATHASLPLEKKDKELLRDIVDGPGVYTLQIEHSPQKADQMRKKVKKYFE